MRITYLSVTEWDHLPTITLLSFVSLFVVRSNSAAERKLSWNASLLSSRIASWFKPWKSDPSRFPLLKIVFSSARENTQSVSLFFTVERRILS
jgi:hypothetical protein